jgi:hypothetical protein
MQIYDISPSRNRTDDAQKSVMAVARSFLCKPLLVSHSSFREFCQGVAVLYKSKQIQRMYRSSAVQNSRKQIIFFNILYPSMPGFLSRLFKPEAAAELVPLCNSFSYRDTLDTVYYIRSVADLCPNSKPKICMAQRGRPVMTGPGARLIPKAPGFAVSSLSCWFDDSVIVP